MLKSEDGVEDVDLIAEGSRSFFGRSDTLRAAFIGSTVLQYFDLFVVL